MLLDESKIIVNLTNIRVIEALLHRQQTVKEIKHVSKQAIVAKKVPIFRTFKA